MEGESEHNLLLIANQLCIANKLKVIELKEKGLTDRNYERVEELEKQAEYHSTYSYTP